MDNSITEHDDQELNHVPKEGKKYKHEWLLIYRVFHIKGPKEVAYYSNNLSLSDSYFWRKKQLFSDL